MTADDMKKATALAAIEYVQQGTIIGVGTGSTANFFIDALIERPGLITAAVASSEATAERLKAGRIDVQDLNATGTLSLRRQHTLCLYLRPVQSCRCTRRLSVTD